MKNLPSNDTKISFPQIFPGPTLINSTGLLALMAAVLYILMTGHANRTIQIRVLHSFCSHPRPIVGFYFKNTRTAHGQEYFQ